MKKKIAVVAVNPVNGFGLFQYLETFFENQIPYRTFAVAETADIRTNSGIPLQLDGTISDLKGHEKEYRALVFACGDAMPSFMKEAEKPYNQTLLAVIRAFDEQKKILAGHCAAALLFEAAEAGVGKRMAVHPYARKFLQKGTAADEKTAIDGYLYTAETEHALALLLPEIVNVLK
ncbi:MAG: DJ-1/PfpI family protein [Planctomycetaceae bacterium]|jgi:putative intracellular protease/amidase|nr:DJ-1/PfpI family protein [Planctomycetaceae bacterium]